MSAKKKNVVRRSGNPVDSEWYSTPEAQRGRKRFTVTLEPETIALIKEEHERTLQPYSQIVEESVLDHIGKKRRNLPKMPPPDRGRDLE